MIRGFSITPDQTKNIEELKHNLAIGVNNNYFLE